MRGGRGADVGRRPRSAGRDPALYRPNVGLALFNRQGQVFYGRRVTAGLEADGGYQWQMPQGGIDEGETPAEAAARELEEEIGVGADLVEILEETADWIFYDFPPDIRRRLSSRKERFLGQRQKWFALRFKGQDRDVRLDRHTPEFSAWRWGALAEAPSLIIPFKRPVYEEIARRFRRFEAPV
jgi:putative (di)nucleoside polyphosphate hydrolase